MSADLRNLILERKTEKAIQVTQTRGPNRTATTCWLPRSQVDYLKEHGMRDPDGAQRCDLRIPEWLADEKGLDY